MPDIKLKPSKYADFMHAAKVRTPKYKFHVEIGGDENAPTILMIMGLGAQMLAWPNDFCKCFIDAGFKVIRFDNRDMGKSSKLKKKNKLTKENKTLTRQLMMISRFKLGLSNHGLDVPYNLFDMAEDVHQLMNVLDIKQCHVLGMSMGGMIAQILAAQHPKRVLSLGLLATSNNRPFLPPPFPQPLLSMIGGPKDKKNQDEVIKHTVRLLKAIGSPQYFDEDIAKEHATVLYQRKFYPKGAMRQLIAVMATGSLIVTDKHITVPTLVVHGNKDRVFLPAHGRAIAKAITGAKFELVKGLGHDIPTPMHQQISGLFITHFKSANNTPITSQTLK